MANKKKEDGDELEELVSTPDEKDKKSAIDGVLVSESEFKGNKMIVLKRNPEDKYPMQMGKTKCRLIVDNIDAIIEFLEKYEK